MENTYKTALDLMKFKAEQQDKNGFRISLDVKDINEILLVAGLELVKPTPFELFDKKKEIETWNLEN